MWNFLIVLILAIILFMLNPLKFTELKPSIAPDGKTKNEVNQAVDKVQKQVEYARRIQEQEQAEINN